MVQLLRHRANQKSSHPHCRILHGRVQQQPKRSSRSQKISKDTSQIAGLEMISAHFTSLNTLVAQFFWGSQHLSHLHTSTKHCCCPIFLGTNGNQHLKNLPLHLPSRIPSCSNASLRVVVGVPKGHGPTIRWGLALDRLQ